MQNPYSEGYLLHDVGRQYQEVVSWALAATQPLEARLAQLSQQIKGFFIDLTEEGVQSFSNHFARMSYVAQAAKLDGKLTYYLHQFDRETARTLRGESSKIDGQQLLLLGSKAFIDAIEGIVNLPCPAELALVLPKDYLAFQLQAYTVTEFKPQLRAMVLEVMDDRELLRVRIVDDPGHDHLVHYGREGYNRQFVQPAVKLIASHFELPLEVNLLSVEVDAEGALNPQHLIIDPDFLVDITSISKCFDVKGAEPVKYLLGRVTPFTSSVALMAGNVANHFLDAAVTKKRQEFLDGFSETFSFYPLQYAGLSDDDVRDLMVRCEAHHKVIGDCVTRHFPDQSINPEEVVVEPSFYAERYGLQGRLDLFLPPKSDQDAAIVELKSGKIFRPNQHRVNQDHYVQTLLYDLLVKSVFSDKAKPRNYILYSGDKEEPLRYAPPNRAQQYEALMVRNQMMAIERLLALSQPGKPCPLDWLRPDRYPDASGFILRDLEQFYAAYSSLDELERDYVRAFVGFIAREQRLAKVGSGDVERLSGQAVLWRETLENKLEGYAILHDLKLEVVAAKDGFPILTFQRPQPAEGEEVLTSFRRGDIIVLYAGDARRQAVLRGQVYKGTIISISDTHVKVRLRASQPDTSRFGHYQQWNIEGDLFDSSFTRLYQNLAEFASAKPHARGLVLGTVAPARPLNTPVAVPAALTQEQKEIFRAVINARDYYLLWGPPGTGKTSVMLHHLCAHFVNRTQERVLVLAYTNRAVDEICRAISQIGDGINSKYLRIGSSFACEPQYTGQLLQERLKHAQTRQDILDLLASQRIVVGTVSSVLGKGEALFGLVKFDRLIVDEASQLLEPLMANLLTRFPRTVLIGDHRQLPAVVTQAEVHTKIEHPSLRAIGLTDMRNSLFERLYERAHLENWDWAYGVLTRQGRMHASLAAYANEAFYDNRLQGLGKDAPSSDWQLLPNTYNNRPENCTPLEELFCQHSFVVVNTAPDLTDKAFRTNQHEAAAVVAALGSLIRIKAAQHQELEPKQVGIITPYRAQIARLRVAIRQSDLPQEWHEVAIDTVERFQGSSYQIVLLSLCANQPAMVSRLSSTNSELKDRKLNVALTRARERVIAFGNVDLLRGHNAAYAHFIDWCAREGGVEAGG